MATAKKRNKTQKDTNKAGVKAGMVVQSHGGQIWQGAPANPVAGTGRPPSAIRAIMRQHLDLEVLADVMAKYRTKELGTMEVAEYLAKYGLGEKTEIEVTSHPEVQRFVSLHAQATRDVVGDEQYARIAERLKELGG